VGDGQFAAAAAAAYCRPSGRPRCGRPRRPAAGPEGSTTYVVDGLLQWVGRAAAPLPRDVGR
jgi:hypothetical protein